MVMYPFGANKEIAGLPFSQAQQVWVRVGTGWSLSSHRYQNPLLFPGEPGNSWAKAQPGIFPGWFLYPRVGWGWGL